jgi:hypothetical protein
MAKEHTTLAGSLLQKAFNRRVRREHAKCAEKNGGELLIDFTVSAVFSAVSVLVLSVLCG